MKKKQNRSIRIEKRGYKHYEIIKDRGDGINFSIGTAQNLMDAKHIKKQNLWGTGPKNRDIFIPVVKNILTGQVTQRGRVCKTYDEALTIANNMHFDSFNEYLSILEEKKRK